MLFSGADVILTEDHLKKNIILSKGKSSKKKKGMLCYYYYYDEFSIYPLEKSKSHQQHERKGKLDEICGIKSQN